MIISSQAHKGCRTCHGHINVNENQFVERTRSREAELRAAASKRESRSGDRRLHNSH